MCSQLNIWSYPLFSPPSLLSSSSLPFSPLLLSPLFSSILCAWLIFSSLLASSLLPYVLILISSTPFLFSFFVRSDVRFIFRWSWSSLSLFLTLPFVCVAWPYICAHCQCSISAQAMSFDIVGAVAQARDVACVVAGPCGRRDGKSTLDIVALVESTRQKFRRRSWELTKHARSAKNLCSAQTQKLKLGQKAEVKVNNFNDNVAVRHSEVINLTVVNKRDIVKGRGQYKSWTPNAVMRACFEVASLPLQGTGTKLVKRCKLKKGPLAMSTQVWVYVCVCVHMYACM